MKNTESELVGRFENEILNWLNSENENGTYIAAILVEIAKQEFLKLNKPAVSKSEDIERRVLLLAFCKYADKKYWVDNEITKYEYAIEGFLKSQ